MMTMDSKVEILLPIILEAGKQAGSGSCMVKKENPWQVVHTYASDCFFLTAFHLLEITLQLHT